MKISKVAFLFVLGCAFPPTFGRPQSSEVLKRVVRSPPDKKGDSAKVDSVYKNPENVKNYNDWAKEISPGIQSAVDQYFAQKKAEADEIEKKGDESRLHEMGPMMEKGQYDVMKKNFRWANDQFAGVKMPGNDSTSEPQNSTSNGAGKNKKGKKNGLTDHTPKPDKMDELTKFPESASSSAGTPSGPTEEDYDSVVKENLTGTAPAAAVTVPEDSEPAYYENMKSSKDADVAGG